MKLIGITGPSGAGKSKLCQYLHDNGVAVIDADKVYHQLLIPPSRCLDALTLAFGKEIIADDGTLDRKALSKIVFNDKKKLELLNSTVLGIVIEESKKIIAELDAKGEGIVAIDAPTLIESGFNEECDIVISVLCPPEIRVERIILRDKIDRTTAIERTRAQKPDDFYISHSDHIIVNKGDEKDFAFEVENLFRKLDI